MENGESPVELYRVPTGTRGALRSAIGKGDPISTTTKRARGTRKAYFGAHPENDPKEKRIDEWNKRQADGGRHVGSSHGRDGRIR